MQQHTQHQPIGGSYFSQAPSLHDCHPRMVMTVSSGVVNGSRDGEAERVSEGDLPRLGDGEFRFPSNGIPTQEYYFRVPQDIVRIMSRVSVATA